MILDCERVREAAIDLACGEEPAGSGRAGIEEHLERCPACRDFQREVMLLFASGDESPALDWRRFHATMERGARQLAARTRLETGFFAALACVAAGLWLGLGAIHSALPVYLYLGIAANLSLFFLPLHLSHRRREV